MTLTFDTLGGGPRKSPPIGFYPLIMVNITCQVRQRNMQRFSLYACSQGLPRNRTETTHAQDARNHNSELKLLSPLNALHGDLKSVVVDKGSFEKKIDIAYI